MLFKCCIRYASKFGKLSSGHRTGKGQFSFQSQRKALPKNGQTTAFALISHASKVMLKILQARLQSTWTKNFQMFNLDLEKTAESEIKLSTSVGLLKKKENTRKTSAAAAAKSLLSCPTLCDPNDGSPPGFPVHLLLLYWLCQSLWLCRSQQTVENSSKRREYQTIWPASLEICMQVKKQQLELDME